MKFSNKTIEWGMNKEKSVLLILDLVNNILIVLHLHRIAEVERLFCPVSILQMKKLRPREVK